MDDLSEILNSAASSPRHPLDPADLETRIRSRRTRRRTLRASAAAVLVVVGVAGLVAAAGLDSGDNVVPTGTTGVPATTTPPTPTTSVSAVESTVPTSTTPPTVGESMTVTVTDGLGKPFPASKSGVRACPIMSGSIDCNGLIDSVDDNGDGIVEIALRSDTDYAVNAFAYETGWPCPTTGDDGTTFHHSDKQTVNAGGSIDGATFVVERPNPDACPSDLPSVVINLFDDAGNSLANTPAFLVVCGYHPLFPVNYPIGEQYAGCSPESGFIHPGADNLIRISIDSANTYDIASFLKCADGSMLGGQYNRQPGGYPMWTTTGTDLLADDGLDLIIPGDIDACLGG